MASSSGASKVCFNSTCNQALELPRRGWLCRTGDFADLCDRCGSDFEDGKFCDTYHLNASGWRCCESCGKQIHCGCIVSFHMFILLDAGGIECLKCAKTEYILVCKIVINDISAKSWRSIAGSGPVPWRQGPNLFSAFKGHPELQVTSCSLGQSTRIDPSERFVNSWRPQEMTGNKALASSKIVSFINKLSSCNLPFCSGMHYDGQNNLFNDVSYQSFFHANAIPLSSLPATFVPHCQKTETGNASGIHVKRLCIPPSIGKQCSNNNGPGPSVEKQAHIPKAQGETQASHQLLPRYRPQSIDQEIQRLYGGSNTTITPLFEKVLSASDAGKIGRLVLPKKCAETYLPSISEPEGYPLVIKDLKGKDWVLQYRFWPNNNSRMYVLDYIQSMQLQAGDTVTFGRLEPEGKLVMGFRKASLAYPSDKSHELTNTRIFAHEESLKDGNAFKSRKSDGALSEVDKISIRAKRKKGGNMNGKSLKHKEEEICQLSVTLEQVQGLLQPPLANTCMVVLIDGVEFEAFQEAPIIRIPKAFSTENVGSLCSPKVEPTPEHQEHMLPMIDHENFESLKTMESVDPLADLAVHDGKASRQDCHKPGCMQLPNGTNHKSTCTCNVCLALNRPTPPPMMMHHDPEQVGTSVQNPSRSMYADIICYTQMGNSNKNHKTGPARSFENDPSRENISDSTFKSQNIDLNMQPEREEESYSVSDAMGIMSLVQESTQRYIKQQKLSVNGITYGAHKNHGL
ncbi:hypothetical protein R6Q59_005055 [Mikania micrantha]